MTSSKIDVGEGDGNKKHVKGIGQLKYQQSIRLGAMRSWVPQFKFN